MARPLSQAQFYKSQTYGLQKTRNITTPWTKHIRYVEMHVEQS